MFITFEGIEGAGKSTVMDALCRKLEAAGTSYLRTREPGGSDLGKRLRALLLDARQDIAPEAELFLYLADRAQHVRRVIRPALERGDVVLSDRYADSTIVYQGGGRGLDPDKLEALNEIAVGGLWPDMTLLLDLDPGIGLPRARARNQDQSAGLSEGRFEAEELAFHERIRKGYLERAARDSRFRIIDASGPREKVLAKVLDVLAPALHF